MSLPGSMPAGMDAVQMMNWHPGTMGVEGEGYSGGASLMPLPPVLRQGLPAVAFFGFLSFFMSTGLMVFMLWRLQRWRRESKESQPVNQFIILIFNLLFADIQQSIAFLLNVKWVAEDMIHVPSSTCWAQGWFVSTGDLASGVWCLAIGVHTFAAVLFNFRLSRVPFYTTIALLWTFVYGCAILSVAIHPTNLYTRAGAWCWVNDQYSNVRLYLHYLWIFVAELGVIILYAAIFLVLVVRIRSGFYSEAIASRAKSVAMLMAVYPAVYVVCTLPLAAARTAAMAGRDIPLEQLVIAGAMITSNGWLDVLLYALTRRILIFSDDPPPEDCGIATFQLPWECPSRFGTFTTISACCEKKPTKFGPLGLSRKSSKSSSQESLHPVTTTTTTVFLGRDGNPNVGGHSAGPAGTIMDGPSWRVTNYSRKEFKRKTCLFNNHSHNLIKGSSVKAETTVDVTSTPMDEEDLKEMRDREERDEEMKSAPLDEDMSLDFQTRPAGL